MTRAHGGPTDEGEGYTTLSADYVFRDTGTKSAAGAASLDDGIRDTTAESLFRELKAESEAGDPLDDFEGLSAASIVDAAEGHEHEQFTDGGQTIAAGSEVESLLIPERSEGDEFRWVDPDPSDGDATDAADETVDADAADLFEPADEGNPDETLRLDDVDLDAIGDADGSDARRDTGSAAGTDAEANPQPDDGNSGGLIARILSFLGLR